jgi:endo-1,4-beta-xylanase
LMIERGCPEHITRRGLLLKPIVLSGLALPTDTLQGRAARGVIMYGGAVSYHHLQDRAYQAAVLHEMKILVPENEFKWEALHPSPTTYDFARADALLHFARVDNKHIRGHCLAWHTQLPQWF